MPNLLHKTLMVFAKIWELLVWRPHKLSLPICYKERLKCYTPATISGIIEGRMRIEKYMEKKNGNKTNKWDTTH